MLRRQAPDALVLSSVKNSYHVLDLLCRQRFLKELTSNGGFHNFVCPADRAEHQHVTLVEAESLRPDGRGYLVEGRIPFYGCVNIGVSPIDASIQDFKKFDGHRPAVLQEAITYNIDTPGQFPLRRNIVA